MSSRYLTKNGKGGAYHVFVSVVFRLLRFVDELALFPVLPVCSRVILPRNKNASRSRDLYIEQEGPFLDREGQHRPNEDQSGLL